MKKLIISAFLFQMVQFSFAQIILNGNFALGTTFWGCSPESNNESLYGGVGTNPVAEVDALAGLCQTVSGLVPGQTYALTYNASRRTGGCPAPAITNVVVTIANLSVTAIYTNTTFGWISTVFFFTASSFSHMLTFSAGAGFGGSSCGLIIDDVAVSNTALPVELVSFTGAASGNAIAFNWTTVTEKNNDHFEVQRSSNGDDFQTILSVHTKAPSGRSSSRLDYVATDDKPLNDMNYYRLKQIDRDGTFTLSHIIAVDFQSQEENNIMLYPNPNNGEFTLWFAKPEQTGDVKVMIVGSLGKILLSEMYTVDKTEGTIKISMRGKLSSGNYHCLVVFGNKTQNFPLLVEN